MGIRGLTTFVANNSDKYLENFKLHDSYIIVDGNNIASHIYQWHCKSNDCFGGDYDKYANAVYKFFSILSKCNVIPLIIFDGAYEDRKLRTLFSRLKDRVKAAKSLNSVTEGSVHMLPLFLRELFRDIVLKLRLKTVRCDFEGDYETACIARTLKCPVLSYDSDFYIFDVPYIPFASFNMQVSKIEGGLKFISCQIYKIDNFLKSFGGIDRQNLPLLATLLGNDYIKPSVFKKFYSQIKLPKRKHLQSDKQRQIAAVIEWLKDETFESAVKKILGRLKMKQRKFVAKQIEEITQGYVCRNSLYMKYLEIEPVNIDSKINNIKALLENISLEDEVEDEIEEESSNSSDESEELDLEIPECESVSETSVPQWFLDKFRVCKYPSCFMDMVYKNTYYFIPQIEDYSNTCSHDISLKLICAIHKILTSGLVKSLCLVSRDENSLVKRYYLPSPDIEVPKLSDLQHRNCDINTKTLLGILDIDQSFVENVLMHFPSSWGLYIIAVKYWTKNAVNLQVTMCHIYTLMLSAILIQTCDELLGFHRSTKKFHTKYEAKIQKLLSKISEKSAVTHCDDIVESLNNVTAADALLCMNDLINYFQMDYKMRSNLKLFEISVVDIYSQFQSCLLHIKYLNSLLNEPFEDIVVSDFFDGTFIYNMCVNLLKRSDLNMYVATLLKNSPTVLNSFKLITYKLNIDLKVPCSTNSIGKRRKRRKNKAETNLIKISTDANVDESDDDYVDANNRYSLLLKNKNVF